MALTKSLQKLIYITILVTAGIILNGCGKSQRPELNLTSASPSGGATAVARDGAISMTFTEELEANTVNAQTISVKDDMNAVVEAENIEVSGNMVTFKPKGKLYPSSTYTVTVAAGITGKGGAPLPKEISYQFTTRSAAWGAPFVIGDQGDAVVAVDAKGNAIIAWGRYNFSTNACEIMMSQSSGGSWTAPQVISGSSRNAFFPQIAMDRDGNATVVWGLWQQPTGIVIKEFRDGRWKENVTVDMGGYTLSVPSVAMNPDGKTVIVWEQEGNIYKLEARDGIMSAVEKISATPYCVYPKVKMSKAGSVIVTWQFANSSHNKGKLYSREYIGGVWNEPKVVSFIGRDPSEYKLASDGDGNAIIVWYQFENNNTRVYKNEFRNNRWGTPVPVSPSGAQASRPHVAMSDSGTAILTWQQADSWLSQLSGICAMEYKNGTWASYQLISPPGITSILPNVTLDRKGNGFLLWNQASGAKWELYRVGYHDRRWGNKELMSVSNNELNPICFSTSTNGGGDAAIVWKQSDGARWQLYLSQYQ